MTICMTTKQTAIPDVIVFQPSAQQDARGFFIETYRASWFDKTALNPVFVQDNHSLSHIGTLRGLHLQTQQPQGKLVRVSAGKVFNVAVDLRIESPSYGQWVGEHLSAKNHHVMWIPAGFANGFITLSDTAELLYKCTDYYDQSSEISLLWNDSSLNIDWPTPNNVSLMLSEKDQSGRIFKHGMGFYQGQWQEPCEV